MNWQTGVEWLILLCLWGIVRLIRNPVEEGKYNGKKL